MNDGMCPRFHLHLEIVEHMFFECKMVRRRWAAITIKLMGTNLAPTFMKNLIGEILYVGINRAHRNPVPLVIIVEMIVSIWWERNQVNFWGDRSQIPILRLLSATENHSQVLLDTCESTRKRRKWEEGIRTLHEVANPPIHNMRQNE